VQAQQPCFTQQVSSIGFNQSIYAQEKRQQPIAVYVRCPTRPRMFNARNGLLGSTLIQRFKCLQKQHQLRRLKWS